MATEKVEPNVDEAVASAQAELGDDFEEVELPEPAPASEPVATESAAAPQPTEEDPLDREIPTERLSGYWKNRAIQTGQPVRVRDVMDSAQSAEEKIRQQGEKANAALDKTRVLEAQIQAMQSMMARQPARAPSYEDVGVRDPNEVAARDPEAFGRGTAELGARIARNEIDPKLQNVEQSVQSVQQRLDMLDVRQAAESARAMLNVPVEEWQATGPFIYARTAALSELGGPKSAQAWVQAYREFDAIRPKQPLQRTSVPKEGLVRGNPPGTARPVPAQTAGKPKARVRGLVSSVAIEAMKNGMPEELARQLAEETELILQHKEERA